MADKHTIIQTQVITDWSVQKRGRLFICQQGTFRYMHSEGCITINPYPPNKKGKKVNGFPDLFGFELITVPHQNPGSFNIFPVFCMVEVKTYVYPELTEEQINHLNYCVQIGGKAYVARESGGGYDLTPWEVK